MNNSYYFQRGISHGQYGQLYEPPRFGEVARALYLAGFNVGRNAHPESQATDKQKIIIRYWMEG